jgi:hypothetical protein
LQSVARRYLAGATTRAKNASVAKIQSAWRGFWGFSHYIIMQYEATRLQALVRGKIARQAYSLRIGCAIIIQATVRQYLAKNIVDIKVISDALVAASAQQLREKNASKRIQFWWRIVLDWTKEKKAALTIERFFINVRKEVDREIVRRERRKESKKEERRKKRKESDDSLLERVWLNTVDEDKSGSFAQPSEGEAAGENGSRSRSAPRLRSASPGVSGSPNRGHRPLPPHKMKLGAGARREQEDSRPTDAVHITPSEDASEMSNITNPSWQVLHGRTAPTDLTDENSLEEAYADADARRSKEKRMSTDEYIKKYGLKSAPNRLSSNRESNHHFFSEDGSSNPSHKPVRLSSGTPRTPTATPSRGRVQPILTPSHGRGGTPRSSSTPRSSYKQQQSSSPRTRSGSKEPTSPRGRSGSKERQSFFPPATPPRPKTEKYSRNLGQVETLETASYSSQTNQTSYASPRSRPERLGNSAYLMKQSYPDEVIQSQEVDFLGDEFGEV